MSIHPRSRPLGEVACEQRLTQWLHEEPVNDALHLASAVLRVEPCLHQERRGGLCQLNVDPALPQSYPQVIQNLVDDLLHCRSAEGIEEDQLLNPIQQFWPECPPDGIDDAPVVSLLHSLLVLHRGSS